MSTKRYFNWLWCLHFLPWLGLTGLRRAKQAVFARSMVYRHIWDIKSRRVGLVHRHSGRWRGSSNGHESVPGTQCSQTHAAMAGPGPAISWWRLAVDDVQVAFMKISWDSFLLLCTIRSTDSYLPNHHQVAADLRLHQVLDPLNDWADDCQSQNHISSLHKQNSLCSLWLSDWV